MCTGKTLDNAAEPVAWFIADDNGEVYRATGYEHERDQWRAVGHEVFPLYASAQSEGLRKDAWQPIEIAPKDGSEVLLYLGAPWSKIEKARWYEPWANWQCGVIPSDPVREEYFGIGSSVPTHWMPLPEAPAALSQHTGEKDD